VPAISTLMIPEYMWFSKITEVSGRTILHPIYMPFSCMKLKLEISTA
jgi:hypothetical protein